MLRTQIFDISNILALAAFTGGWAGYVALVDFSPLSRYGLSQRMNLQRRNWMRTLLRRDLRMIDTAIMAGLQQGTGFFASGCIFAIGGCFALIGSAERIAAIVTDLPLAELSVSANFDRGLVEAKLLGLVTIFAYAFFKFGWAYRLFNYCTILIGAIPMRPEALAQPEIAERAVERAYNMNLIAARQFNAGLRAVFFGLGYLGWFLGPMVLIGTTIFVVAILAHRQFLSAALKSLPAEPEPEETP